MLKPISPQSIGTTDFFRNRAFIDTRVDLLLPLENPRIIFHTCSCGAEPLSFAVRWRERRGGRITIHATDVKPLFLSMAKTITHERVTARDRELITFLTPRDTVTFRANELGTDLRLARALEPTTSEVLEASDRPNADACVVLFGNFDLRTPGSGLSP